MSEISEIIKSTIEELKTMSDSGAVLGSAITTQSGITIIPVSKLTVGIIGGGVDYGQKKLSQTQNFGGGSGAAISINPVAFLTINADSSVNILHISGNKTHSDRIFSLLERSPEIINKLKNSMS